MAFFYGEQQGLVLSSRLHPLSTISFLVISLPLYHQKRMPFPSGLSSFSRFLL